ncbi:MAG: hypothetical protein D6729_10280 [Deltaproteobacteria bacterium]|nr:MAG: hypothetical protein D6729_10280 [Deltaproteobacteria bacterium]
MAWVEAKGGNFGRAVQPGRLRSARLRWAFLLAGLVPATVSAGQPAPLDAAEASSAPHEESAEPAQSARREASAVPMTATDQTTTDQTTADQTTTDRRGEQTTELAERPGRLTLRLFLLSGLPDVAGVAATLTYLRPFEFEAGLSTLVLASSVYARAGYAFSVLDGRAPSGTGWVVDLSVLAGWRYMQTVPFDVSYEIHALGLALATDATFWATPSVGVSLQLVLGGLYYAFDDHPNGPPSRVVPDLRFSVGLAL